MNLREQLSKATLSEMGFRDLVHVQKDASVGDAVSTMRESRVGCCAVLEGERLVGIFTERNLATRVFGAGLGLDAPIEPCMTRDPITATPEDPLHLVLTRMHHGGFRHLPVVDHAGKPIGMTSVKRAVRLLGRSLESVIYNVPPEPGRFPTRAEGG